jgi:hypothetical protein
LCLVHICGAKAAIGTNPYYGFDRNIAAAKSTGYKTIAWVAKELLVRLSSETALTRYQG